MESIWNKSIQISKHSKLNGDKKTDVLIIGGGMAGVLCAYLLEQHNIDYILVEGSRICSGITKNTTAKITSQHGLNYYKMLNSIGAEKTRKYLEVNQMALQKYFELCKNINCNMEVKNNYVYSLNDANKIEKEIVALEKIGFKADFSKNLPLPFETAGAVMFPNQAQFNPLKFVSEITPNMKIFEDTFVREIQGNTAITDSGKITAQNIIVTTHFPFINKHGSYFLKLYQHRSYVIALENAQNVDGMYLDENKTGLSFRNYQDLLLLGGGSHRTGKQGGNWAELRNVAQKYYPTAKERFFWATQDCMSLDKIPYIGEYSKRTSNLYVASGFNKWGMTSSMVSAMILTDMIIGKTNEYAEVFNPSRSILKPQLLANAFEATTNLLSFSKKRCPHLGCALKWNNVERTWDCPCHGSRFSKDGILIDNPSTDDLK